MKVKMKLDKSSSQQSSTDEQIDWFLLDELISTFPLQTFAMSVVVVFEYVLLNSWIPEHKLLPWLGLQAGGVALIMVPLYLCYQRWRLRYQPMVWRYIIITAAVVVGLTVGSFPIIVFGHLDPIWVIFLTMAIAFGAPGCLVFFLTHIEAWVALCVTLTLPAVFYLIWGSFLHPTLETVASAWILCYLAYIYTGARKMIETKRQNLKLQVDLALVNQAKTKFLAAANHDIRQPLHAFGLHLDVLSRAIDTPEHQEKIEKLQRSAINLNDLFDSLFDISRLDGSNIEVHACKLKLNDSFERLQKEMQPFADAKGIRLRFAATRCLIHTDPALFERILRNLIANAIAHTNSGGVLLGCRRRRNNQVEIQVLDTGSGIPETEMKAIFDEFYQVAANQQRSRENLGLGLSIVKRFCELLEIDLNVRSVLDKGSNFSVLLKRLDERKVSVPAQNLDNTVAENNSTIVVVIEDDCDVLESTRLLLEEWQYRAYCASTLNNLLHKLEAGVELIPDLIVADFHLGNDQTGPEVVANLRKHFARPIPGIIVSSDQTLDHQRIKQEHNCEFLCKPVNPARLRTVVSRLLAD